METVVELQHFYFAYKKNNLVLHDIDFKIERGSFTVIAGPSGAAVAKLRCARRWRALCRFTWAARTAAM